ncbi:a97f8ef6-a9b0-4f8b-8fdf-2c72f37eda9e [Staphylotrichum tortipilum]|uniref:A97f8ef6-a9b0-4f8b-8fdf-2c72f37eda9e n=1 Tax=Staphylotrichum tortipilum TaxID=2831512 RepID=A0AAN6RSG9_9PEZI|nr:a97f8ef6-a9b0-4f8b-8fdf-2c72f37eda9e [Staphylotrichum longicolle]
MEDPLCNLCAALDIPGVVQRLVSDSDPAPLDSPWHNTLADVKTSSASCTLCALILKGWQASRAVVVQTAVQNAMFDPQDPPTELDEPVEKIAGYRDAPGVALEAVRRVREVGDGRGARGSVFLRVGCGPKVRSSWDVLDPVVAELRVARELWEEEIGPGGVDAVVKGDPLAEESLDVARGWLRKCQSRHGAVCGGAEGWLPTRLLQVVPGDDSIYLRHGDSLPSPSGDARYVALSHCWGQGGTPITTTHLTLPLRTAGINTDLLPQTFRDAVTLTHHLNLRYLWIDSLCIIQDDAADWAAEAARMADVYRNAHLVLDAANADADAAGFLRPRAAPDTVRLRGGLALSLLPPQGRRWTDPEGRQDNLAGEPISARAWCLQERVLPRRALLYGEHQMFWECECVRASEDGDVVCQVGGGALGRLCKTAGVADSVFSRVDRNPGNEMKQETNWAAWYRMVEDYTARSITKHTDRLPALSGLAQGVVRERGGEYLAGLWKSGLLEGLLWCKARPGPPALAATPEYVAPSWSWASVAGPVQFPMYDWYTRRAHWKAKMADFESLAEYLGHETVKRDVDDFGRLQGGVLALKAPLLSVQDIRPRQARAPALYSLFGHEPGRSEVADIMVQLKTGSGSLWIEGAFDIPGTSAAAAADVVSLSVVFFTRLPHVLEEGFVEHRFGLILQRSGNSSRYRRVGFVDGVVLKKSMLDAVRGRGMFSVVGYPRPYKEGDLDEVARNNDLASDPLMLGRVEVVVE